MLVDEIACEHVLTNQQFVAETLNPLVKDSLLDFPPKNNEGIFETEALLVETMSAHAYNREEQNNFAVKAEESDRTTREMEWSSRLWNFDLDKGDEDIAGWQLDKREKWLSLLWDCFLNGWDKIESGEYELSKPPKKSGGTSNLKSQKGFWKVSLFFTIMFASTACALGGVREPELTLDFEWCMLVLSLILKLVLMFGIVLQVFQLTVKLWAGVELVCEFIDGVESFIDRFGVDSEVSSYAHLVLFKCLCRDAPLTAKGDPEERVQNFFRKLTKMSLNYVLNSHAIERMCCGNI